MNQKLFTYIAACPTAYHTAAHTAAILADAGYTALSEGDDWAIEPGRGYYVTRNGSSIIAFRVPTPDFRGFMMAAAHGDSPCFKIKENAELGGSYIRLSTEKYGGMMCATWMDRPLSVAGRVMLRTERGIETRLVNLAEPCAMIPNVAIHMNRRANDGMTYDAHTDMIPLWGGEAGSYRAKIAAALGVAESAILTTDLCVYNPERGTVWGPYISAPRLDDLQCAFAALEAFLAAKESGSAPVLCIFDNEEVGSQTKQGAASTFLFDVLTRINRAMGGDDTRYLRRVANSFLVSADNGHAIHPNHPEYADKNHTVKMNAGVVIKYNAAQKYTTDAVSAGLFRLLCERAGVAVQLYANRADMAGGSTLGNIANTQVSLNTVDIGLAQLAMHSAYETAGADDTAELAAALTALFEAELEMERDGAYRI
ncbi:MAG: M18 family aminopeptidase [Clostridia bacterium]|nr:M18 family aminopeptidase [Clostridia bacterium]